VFRRQEAIGCSSTEPEPLSLVGEAAPHGFARLGVPDLPEVVRQFDILAKPAQTDAELQV